jgi:5-methylthioadenosine/S-adenosylhomocysteine deaminase
MKDVKMYHQLKEQYMTKTLIKNCDLVNFENMQIERKDILINNDRIEKISDQITPSIDYQLVDAGGKLCLPAFVDAHTHLVQTFLKGPLDDMVITDWLVKMISSEGIMTEEEWYYSVYLGALQSIRFGATTVNEMIGYHYLDATVQAYKDAGIRVTFGLSSTDIAENDQTPIIEIDEALRRAEEIYHKYHGKNGGLLRTSVAPAGMPACTPALMKAHKQFADERGLVFHTHLAEGKKETQDVRNMTGLGGEAEALYRNGILDKNTLLAHSIWLADYELDLIRESGANPVHCPNTNMKISDGIPKIYQMLERGINVAMGCDGEASSSTRDLIREARAGSYLQKAVTLDPTAMSAEQCLKMMTVNGARALGYDDIGEIKVGNKADLILVDMSDISLTNRRRRIGNLIYAANGHAVDTVYLEGRPMLRNGSLVQCDMNSVVGKCEELLAGFEARMDKM